MQHFFLYIICFIFLCERNIKTLQTLHNPAHSGRGMPYILEGVSRKCERGQEIFPASASGSKTFPVSASGSTGGSKPPPYNLAVFAASEGGRTAGASHRHTCKKCVSNEGERGQEIFPTSASGSKTFSVSVRGATGGSKPPPYNLEVFAASGGGQAAGASRPPYM